MIRKGRDHGLGPTACGVAATAAIGRWLDSNRNGQATRDQPANSQPTRECRPEHDAEDAQPALPGASMWDGRSVRDGGGEAAYTRSKGPEALRFETRPAARQRKTAGR